MDTSFQRLCDPSMEDPHNEHEFGYCPVGTYCRAPFEYNITPPMYFDHEEINNADFNFGLTGFDSIG